MPTYGITYHFAPLKNVLGMATKVDLPTADVEKCIMDKIKSLTVLPSLIVILMNLKLQLMANVAA